VTAVGDYGEGLAADPIVGSSPYLVPMLIASDVHVDFTFLFIASP